MITNWCISAFVRLADWHFIWFILQDDINAFVGSLNLLLWDGIFRWGKTSIGNLADHLMPGVKSKLMALVGCWHDYKKNDTFSGFQRQGSATEAALKWFYDVNESPSMRCINENSTSILVTTHMYLFQDH